MKDVYNHQKLLAIQLYLLIKYRQMVITQVKVLSSGYPCTGTISSRISEKVPCYQYITGTWSGTLLKIISVPEYLKVLARILGPVLIHIQFQVPSKKCLNR